VWCRPRRTRFSQRSRKLKTVSEHQQEYRSITATGRMNKALCDLGVHYFFSVQHLRAPMRSRPKARVRAMFVSWCIRHPVHTYWRAQEITFILN